MPSKKPRSMYGRNVLHAIGLSRLVRETQLATLRLEGRLLRSPRTARASDRVQILGCTPTYLPETRRGSEITLHAVLRDLASRGHDVRVLRDGSGATRVVDGVEVRGRASRRGARELCEWSDVLIAQLDARGLALRLGARFRRPVVYWMQIGNVSPNALFGDPDLTVFASTTVQRQYPEIGPGLVVHPPVREVDYLTTPGDAITLVEFSESKGSHVFSELARRLPERRFLTIAAERGPRPSEPNVIVAQPTDDMRSLYSRTRILLMPSVYESYGRVGMEAAVSGIPTIAHPAPGIREALGNAAVFARRGDIDAWVQAIRLLDDPTEYAHRSALARRRFEALQTSDEIDALEVRLRALASSTTAAG